MRLKADHAIRARLGCPDRRVDQAPRFGSAQMPGQALTFGIPEVWTRMQRSMICLAGQVVEHSDNVCQQFHISGAVMEAAGKAEFARAVSGHLADGSHHIRGAVPGASLLGVEAVSAGAGIGEGCVDMAVAIDAQVAAVTLQG